MIPPRGYTKIHTSKYEFSQETQDWNNNYKGRDVVLPVMELKERISEIEKLLLYLKPDFEKMEKYPALKEAYEAYQIINGLTR